MTDPIVRVFREAARHGIDELGEGMIARQVSEWLGADGRAAFEAARESGKIVPAGGTDAYGDRTWRLGGVLTALASRVELLSLQARVRALDRALAAGKFRPRPGMKYDEKAKGYWVTVNGSPVLLNEGDDVGEKLAERRSEGGNGSGSGGNPKKNRPAGSGDPGDDDIIITMRDYTAGSTSVAVAVRDEGLEAGSWLPIEKTIWKDRDKNVGRKVYRRYSRNGQPVWLIAVTDNRGDFNDATKEAFQGLLDEDGYPSVGTWTDPETKKVYNDTMFFFSGTEAEAGRLKKKYDQKAIMKVNEDGSTDFF